MYNFFQIFHSCGKPNLNSRPVRSANRNRELHFESLNFNSRRKDSGDARSHADAITKLVREIKTKVSVEIRAPKSSREFVYF